MTRVYTLKRATPRMKYQHMRDVLDFRANLADLKANPPDRHVMLDEINRRMGGEFYEWFADVYKLRSANRQEEYEQAILKKLRALLRKEKRDDQTATANR